MSKARKYPTWVCYPCGLAAKLITKGFRQQLKNAEVVSTYHEGKCDVCGRSGVAVTEPRDFSYPDFRVLNKAALRRMAKEIEYANRKRK